MTITARFLYQPAPRVPGVLFGIVGVVALLITISGMLYPRPPSFPDTLPLAATISAAIDAGALATAEGDAIGGGADGCTAPVRHGSSSLLICWQAYRLLNEEDVDTDYYGLEVTATLHATGSGASWAAVRVHPTRGTSWDGGTEETYLGPGACGLLTLDSGPVGPRRSVLACEHWSAGSLMSDGQATWNCGLCPVGVIGDRDLALVELVTIQDGDVPSWELSAGFG